MFRLICTRFIINSRTTTYLSPKQQQCFHKPSVQSNENIVLSTVILGNINKQDSTNLIAHVLRQIHLGCALIVNVKKMSFCLIVDNSPWFKSSTKRRKSTFVIRFEFFQEKLCD